MKVAAIQMVSGPTVAANLDDARELISRAAERGAELVVLPEYFCLMGLRDEDKLASQEEFGAGPIQDFLAGEARNRGIWLVGGTMPLSLPDDSQMESQGQRRVYNSTLVFAPSGQCCARYDKIHLFRFDNGVESYDESVLLQPGSSPTNFDLTDRSGQLWRVGLSVCYDLRFPELFRLYASEGADLMLVPSAFTFTTGQAHWELLLRARAIENLAFFVAAAQGGRHENGRETWGQSMLIDPWGAPLAQLAQGRGVVLADLDFVRLTQCRQQLPSLQHRRLPL